MALNDAAEEGASLPRRGGEAAAERGRPEAVRPDLPEFDRLEQTVRRLLEAGAEGRARARAAEHRRQELQEALDAVRTGSLDPHELSERVGRLEAENQALRQRLRSAEALAQRIHARLQLLEDER